jgi:phosphopantothenate synthetase
VDDRLNQLVQTLQDAGLSVVDVVRGPPVVITYAVGMTAAQQVQGDGIVASFDFRRRRPRGLNALIADVNALSTADRNKLTAACLAEFVQRFPQAPSKLGLSVTLLGDELDPTP